MRGKVVAVVVALCSASAACAAPARTSPLVAGAVYPTHGSQGQGGLEEYRGLRLAAEMANGRGGVRGRRIDVRLAAADSPDAVPAVIDRLARAGVRIVAGSHGSTISLPASLAASRKHMLFWETGAVGELPMTSSTSRLVFRFAPTGQSLGGAAVSFVRDVLTSRLAASRPLRYSVAYVDDPYGRAVGAGAIDEIRRSRLTLATTIPYRLAAPDYAAVAARVAAARTDVLVVAAYVDDGVALRKALVDARVPLLANIGTSSSYCMPEFGRRLGPDALGVFASDKPDGDVVAPSALRPGAAAILAGARTRYEALYHQSMTAPALSGFAGGWALFRYVVPAAEGSSADAVARAARRVRLDVGTLPNGSGLAFASTGPSNLRATSVIWEWLPPLPVWRAVVWPPSFATDPVAVLPIAGAA